MVPFFAVVVTPALWPRPKRKTAPLSLSASKLSSPNLTAIPVRAFDAASRAHKTSGGFRFEHSHAMLVALKKKAIMINRA